MKDRPQHFDELEGDIDALFAFPCPFCSVEFNIGSLCSHLEEEHCFESKSVICPVCAAKAGRDVVGHITEQHGDLFKMQRRRARKPSSCSSASFSFESETVSDVAGIGAMTNGPLSPDKKSPRLGTLVCEKNMEEAASQAKFIQQMVLSMVFQDD